jgi:ubiquinone/menaquinone biosynthesis C-methylase UbiE
MEDNFSTIWSTYIQRPETLYKTREIRFRDENKQQYLQALEFKDGMNILDIGCGTGAYCHALERWLPNSKITGIDRDSAFIEYAIEKSKQINSKCSFIIGDAISLEFPDKSFDATTSHTVVEHVEINKFLSEQFRVLKDGGIITVLSVRTSLSSTPESSQIQSEEEKDLWDRVEPYFKSSDQKYGVAKHSINETDLATQMTKSGFHDISIHFIVQTNIPDNTYVNPALAKAMIEADRQVDLDGVALAQALAPEVMSDADIMSLKQLINSRFDQRIHLYETGQKQWDVKASVLTLVRGYK